MIRSSGTHTRLPRTPPSYKVALPPFRYYAGSTDYYSLLSLCWPDQSCFTDSTPTHEAVSGYDLHRDRDLVHNNSDYSTRLFTTEAVAIIGVLWSWSAGASLAVTASRRFW